MTKELEIVIHPAVEAQMAEDPEMAEALRGFMATMHQANYAMQMGQYHSMEDAIEALTGNRPEFISAEELENGTSTN